MYVKVCQDRCDAGGGLLLTQRFSAGHFFAAHGFREKPEEYRKQQARRAYRNEGHLPRTHFTQQRQRHRSALRKPRIHGTPHHVGQPTAQRNAQTVDRQRTRQLFAREKITEHGERRGREGGLTDANPDTREKQATETAGGTAQAGHRTPGHQPGGDNPLAAVAVGEARNR